MARLSTETGVLLILREHAGLQDQYVLPEVLTQRGMAILLEVAVPNLSRTLKRMRTDGLAYERLARIRGKPRKLRTYFATPAGLEAAARAWDGLRERPVTIGSAAGTERLTLAELLLRAPVAGADRVRRIRDALAGPVTLGDDLPAAMVGREGEAQQLRGFIESGSGRILVTGRAGMGKTTLVQAVLERWWSGALEWVISTSAPTPGALAILDDLARHDPRLDKLPADTRAILISRDPGTARDAGEPVPKTILLSPLDGAAIRRFVEREKLAWEPKEFATLTGGVPLLMTLLRAASPDAEVTTEVALLPPEARTALEKIAWLPTPLPREVFEDWFGAGAAMEGLRRGAWALDRAGRLKPHPLLSEQVTGAPPPPDLITDLITDLKGAGLPLEAARLALDQDQDLATAVVSLEGPMLELLEIELRTWLAQQSDPEPTLLVRVVEVFTNRWDPRLLRDLIDPVIDGIGDDTLRSRAHDIRSRLAGRLSNREAQLADAVKAFELAKGEERARLGIRLVRLQGNAGDTREMEDLATALGQEKLTPALSQALWTNLAHGRLATGDEPGMRAAFSDGLNQAVDRPRLLIEYVDALITAGDLDEAGDYLGNLRASRATGNPRIDLLGAAWHLARHEPLPAQQLLESLDERSEDVDLAERDRLLVKALMGLGGYEAIGERGGGQALRPGERAFNLLSAAEGAAEEDQQLASSLARQARALVEDPKRREIIRLKEAEYGWPSDEARKVAERLASGAMDPRVREKARALLDEGS